METLKNFFVFRPVFTRLGLKILWFAFILEFVLRLGMLFAGTLHANLGSGSWVTFLLFLFPSVLYLVLVRLLIEVAEFVLLGGRKA